MHIRLTHNRSRRFHISVETNLLFVHISVRTYILIFDIRIQSIRNNASFIIVNLITMDSIIFVGIDFRKLKKNGKLWILNFVVCGILPDHLL